MSALAASNAMKKLYDHVCTAEAWVAAVLLILMVVLIFLGGVMRMLGHPINWSSDTATACSPGPASSAPTSRGARTA